MPVTSAVDLEWEEFSKQEVKSKHVADLADTCVEVATKAETSDHPSVDSVLPSIAQGTQNLLAIAAATKISFKEAEPIKALLPDSNFSKEEKTNAKAEIHISRTEKASKEAEEMNKLTTSVDKLNTKRSAGKTPYEPRKFDREDFPGLGDRAIIFSAPVDPPRVDFKALGFGPRFLPRPELFPVQGVLRIRLSSCAKMDTTAGQVGATIPVLLAGSMVMVQIPPGTKAQPTASPPHLEPFLALRLTSASSMFPRCCSGGSTTPGLAGTPNGS